MADRDDIIVWSKDYTEPKEKAHQYKKPRKQKEPKPIKEKPIKEIKPKVKKIKIKTIKPKPTRKKLTEAEKKEYNRKKHQEYYWRNPEKNREQERIKYRKERERILNLPEPERTIELERTRQAQRERARISREKRSEKEKERIRKRNRLQAKRWRESAKITRVREKRKYILNVPRDPSIFLPISHIRVELGKHHITLRNLYENNKDIERKEINLPSGLRIEYNLENPRTNNWRIGKTVGLTN